MSILQNNNSDIEAYHTPIKGLLLQDITILGSNCTLFCDVFMHSPQLIIVKLLCHLVFETVHNLAHPGVKPMQKFIMQHFMWYGIKKDITAAWVRSCIVCQLAKVHHHTIAPLHKNTLPKSSFDCIHVNIVGPLPQ